MKLFSCAISHGSSNEPEAYLEPSQTSTTYKGVFVQKQLMATSGQLFSQKSSIVDVWLGSKYASVNITLHLTFLRKALMMKLDEKS